MARHHHLALYPETDRKNTSPTEVSMGTFHHRRAQVTMVVWDRQMYSIIHSPARASDLPGDRYRGWCQRWHQTDKSLVTAADYAADQVIPRCPRKGLHSGGTSGIRKGHLETQVKALIQSEEKSRRERLLWMRARGKWSAVILYFGSVTCSQKESSTSSCSIIISYPAHFRCF